MKKITYLMLIVLSILLLCSCGLVMDEAIFLVDGEYYETITYFNNVMEYPRINPEKEEYIFIGWKYGYAKDEHTHIYNAEWKHIDVIYTLSIETLDGVEEKEFHYDEIINYQAKDYEFYKVKEIIDTETETAFDFSIAPNKNIKLKVIYTFLKDKAIEHYISKINACENDKLGDKPEYNYSTKAIEEIKQISKNSVENLNEIESMDDAENIIISLLEKFDTIYTYLQQLENEYAAINMELYYEDEQNDLKNIYNQAAYELKNYNGSVPYPQYILDKAIEALNKVKTIEEDNEDAEATKIVCIRNLKSYVLALDAEKLGEEKIKLINDVLDEGVKAINEAKGTKAVGDAYADTMEKIENLINQ